MNKPSRVDEWLAQLGQPSADRDYLPGHERIFALLEACPVSRPALRIRVAGTNGKGSTCTMLAAALQRTGLKIGLYTSPHLLSFHERIRVNGVPIADDVLVHLLERLMPQGLEVGASYFEVATVLAWLYFSEQAVDVEILEAGVGARLDATTALPADAGVLTSVGIDHETWLGSNLIGITEEKSYVFQGAAVCVSAPQQKEVQAWLQTHIPSLDIASPWTGALALQGEHQRINAGVAYTLLKRLAENDYLKDESELWAKAIAETQVPGRLQQVAYGKTELLLDAAHNRHAVEALLPLLRQYGHFDAILVYTRDDRSLSDCFAMLKPYTSCLMAEVSSADVDMCLPTVEEALSEVIRQKPQARVLVLGSFLTVAACLRLCANTTESVLP